MIQSQEQILLVIAEAQVTFLVERILRSIGYNVKIVQTRADALKSLETTAPSLVILGEKLTDANGVDLAGEIAHRNPTVPMILFINHETPDLLRSAMRIGINDCLTLPLRADDVLRAVKSSLELVRLRREAVLQEARRATSTLQRRLDELETLTRLARSVTRTLDVDSVLMAVVEAAVELTGSEEGSLLLLDKETGELYMRASRNFQEEFARTFRLPVKDTLAGSVIRSGEPMLLDDNTPQKIKTTYLVQSLMYVPLLANGQVFGVLGVDNRHNRLPFTEHHLKLIITLAEFAVIALENSRLFNEADSGRKKLETILTDVDDGVIILTEDRRVLLVNEVMCDVLQLGDTPYIGRPFQQVLTPPVFTELLDTLGQSVSNRAELVLSDERVMAVQLSAIPGVGLVFTLSDITNLKRLDRIKTDFVHTVSHDLRSPLTAILGYAELIERAGPVNDLQKDFIRRVQVSVHNITSLIDDLLDLGRIESGFDTRKEPIQLDLILRYTLENLKKQIVEKKQQVALSLPPNFPALVANPIQARRLLENLLENAIKYTPQGGRIAISASIEQSQVILQIADSGIGIPTLDLPYIFDKFYRASNISADVIGTGLGLAIVKSIVEQHQGRIWVDSTVGKGTTFTIVLPLSGGS
jgi:signal transduction histidine kinase/FixJ family two-component response regulator